MIEKNPMSTLPPLFPDETITALQAGQEVDRHFEAIFRAYHRNVAGYFERSGIGSDQSRDLTQEVFLAVLGNLGSLRNPASFRSWLFGIARNKLLHHLQSRKHEGTEPAQDQDKESWTERVPDPGPGALDQALEHERRTKLREALEELPQQMRACVKLSLVEGLDYTEIARRLGLSVNTVKVHLYRARQNLAARLGPLFRVELG